ncbi:MAG: restriction endonuclease subunit S [Ruminococcus sp.]|nr:restriction endonuclease subunit S [Ruminococcus sp.]
MPIIGLEHLTPEEITLKSWDTDTDNTFTKVFHEGDILFGRRRAYLKKAALAPFEGICSGDITVICANPESISPELLPFVIQNDSFFDYAVGKSAGSLSPRVKWEHLQNYEFELPDMDTQRNLAKVLWAMNDTAESYKRLISATDELVKSQFIEMFGDPDTNPKQWAVKSIGDIATDVHYGTSKPAIEGGIYPYLRMNNLTADGYIDLTDLKYIDLPENEMDGCLVHYGDILFNRTNSKEWVGKTALFDLDQDMVIAGYIIRVRVNSEVLPCFLVKYMNLPYMKKMLRGMAKGAVHQANINAKEMQSIKLYIPPLELQQQFAELVRQTDKSKFVVQKAVEITYSQKRLFKTTNT